MHLRRYAACLPERVKDFITAVDEKNIIVVQRGKAGRDAG